ncbi:universal stress protein [Humibacillus sp. DSM 29435]|uniref:universal stress protein n=1 Tax=Humibacillus sp. DSM 29435 TaxID=1869167 RepID=UPI000A79E01A|nr:universal stress protein [Humibacillus sp. DSM 29435]
MDPHQMPAGAVVVGYDGSPTAEAALEWAAREASAWGRPLHLLHTMRYPDGFAMSLDLDLNPDRDEIAIAGIEQAQRLAPGLAVTSETKPGGAASWLVELSERADLVVVGGHGHHAARAVLVGATAPQVTAHSKCPVVVVQADSELTPPLPPERPVFSEQGGGLPDSSTLSGRVVVGVDGSESCTGAVEFAYARASRLGLGLLAVGCWWWQESGPYMAGTEDFGWDSSIRDRELRLVSEHLAGWSEQYPDVDVHTILVHGNPVEVLVEEADRAELLVLGTRGRGGFAGLMLGSVSLRVLSAARRPVAIVPSTASSRKRAH